MYCKYLVLLSLATSYSFYPATIFKADPLDPARGKLYRDKILRAGGSREELDTLQAWCFSIHVNQR